ncbi:myomesin-3 [Electrophorus electricus]|uniref:myomesin-3 n=1 Tax=Electrophorus electricus TaxID=8005 RepID=UPI0015D07076|nr:myomesin-3 [Electrophorus electricus]
MATKIVTFHCLEAQEEQMSHSMELSSQLRKKKFTSSDEEASLCKFYPIIPGDIMSVKEILTEPKFPRHRTWEVLRETLADDELRQRDQWTLFGNEAEKVEVEVIRNQHEVRRRVDRLALRREAQRKASMHLRFLEDLSMKAPDFPIPLRPHTMWEGMTVQLSCTSQGSPAPCITWYKDNVPLRETPQPWNYKLQQKYGLNTLEIRRCSPADAGEYKVVARSCLGEASTFATLAVNSYHGTEAGLLRAQTAGPVLDQEASFASTFPPTFVKEGENLVLVCGFSSPLLPFQQDVTWFRDGVPLRPAGHVDLQTDLRTTTLSLKGMLKEHEGLYSVHLRTWDGTVEHSAFVYVKDGPAAVSGAAGSPLQVGCSDVNRDYVFLSWKPPSADGAGPVQGYFIERCEVGTRKWIRCNELIQPLCHYPVMGLNENTMYQFRVCAVNQAGVGRPSKPTNPILTSDPMEPSRTMVVKVERGKEIVITKDQLESQIRVPFPPTDVRVCELSDTYAVMCWTEPDPRGKEPLSYFVERSEAGKESWHLASFEKRISSTRFAAFDLQKGKTYRFRVRSVNKYGVSEPSEASQPVSLQEALGIPAAAHSVQAIRDTANSVLLQWKEPKNPEGILGYYLYCCELGTSEWRTINNKPVTCTRFTVHGLRTGKEYVFRVKSVGRAGNSRYSEESEPLRVRAAKLVPTAPSAISLLRCTGIEMVIAWRAPASNGGDPVRGYYLDQREKSQSTWSEVNVRPVKDRVYTVSGLREGHYYQFRAFAENLIGVGRPSVPSEAFLCEQWTMPVPGSPYDLELREVRQESLVLLWAEPLYQGQSAVTGYVVEISPGEESEDWTAVTKKPITDTQLKVSGLQGGQIYRLRVSAVNSAGVGRPSLPTEPIKAQTSPGSRDIEIGVDDDGFVFMSFEGPETADKGEVKWNKNYREPIEAGRVRLESKQNKSILTFTAASEEDLGLYTAEMTETPGISSGFNFTAADLERLMELSWQVRHPLISLRSEGWQVEVLEQGAVRLWLQTEPLSKGAELRMILNDREISSTPARRIGFDRENGLVDILFNQLAKEDEGSYTAQLKDGRAKNQFTLVLVDEKFKQAVAKAEAKRRDWKRCAGPHFEEFLSWTVTNDCEMILKCKVTNVNKDTKLKWFKDGVEITQATYEQSGVGKYTVAQVTRKEAGVYRAVVSDSRGEDESMLELVDKEFDKLTQQLSKQCALSAGPVRIQCTAAGFKLYCSLKDYLSYVKTSWYFKEKKIDQEERTKPGSSMQKVWIEIFSPTEYDKGKYTLQMLDGQETHTRSLDLSGQAFADALLEYQRLKQVEIAEKNRARVTKGLPDVVAIREDKSLCLTCFADGDPAPEMSWLKNDREIPSAGRYHIALDNKCSTLTIHTVNMEDSGNYSMFVRNKHGTETVSVTVSVYKHGEKPRADAIEM